MFLGQPDHSSADAHEIGGVQPSLRASYNQAQAWFPHQG